MIGCRRPDPLLVEGQLRCSVSHPERELPGASGLPVSHASGSSPAQPIRPPAGSHRSAEMSSSSATGTARPSGGMSSCSERPGMLSADLCHFLPDLRPL